MRDEQLVVVCTDKRRHGRIEIARIDRDEDGNYVPVAVVVQSRAPQKWQDTPLGRRELAANPDFYADVLPVATPVKTPTGWRFPCHRCGRDVPFSDETFSRVATSLLNPFDVSYL
jgi:hypothetical protein